MPGKVFVLFLLIILSAFCMAQMPDTLVVYEYVYETDTVWIDDSALNRDTTLLAMLTSKKDQKIDQKTATISENLLYRVENRKEDEMKKASVFAGVLLTLNSFAFAQPEIGLNIGPSGMFILHNTKTLNNPLWHGAHAGIDLSFPLRKEKLAISTHLQARYLKTSSPYQKVREVDGSLNYIETDMYQIHSNIMVTELNTGMFTAPFYEIDLTLRLKYQKTKLKPFIGAGYSYTSFLFDIPEKFLDRLKWNDNKNTDFNDLKIVVGISYDLNKKLALQYENGTSVIGKDNPFNDYHEMELGIEEYYFNFNSSEISLVVKF